jgi:thymidylate synthase ThyX
MTTIKAEVIAASQLPDGNKPLYTLMLRYPRFIHAEFMTHRVFSRNASSSRAVPVPKLIEDIRRDPAMPLVWGANQAGMQAKEGDHNAAVTVYGWGGGTERSREGAWLLSMENALKAAQAFHEAGYHKQIVNRLLEPYSHINVVVSADEWSNFIALRTHPAAEPHIQLLAWAIRNAIESAKVRVLEPGEWHLPFVTDKDRSNVVDTKLLIAISVARCARVSYLTHEGKVSTVDEDVALYERLVGADPIHASPAEHQATPDHSNGVYFTLDNTLNGNFSKPWLQYRKFLEPERKHLNPFVV